MKNKTFVFAGNRAYVLQKMLEMNLQVTNIWAVNNSYLQRFCQANNINYTIIKNKQHLIDEVQHINFNYFISNGLPIILPISKLKNNNKNFINIHPSLLPKLRGKDPVLGALLLNQNSGATCHIMNNQIDAGDIISQIPIDNSSDLDAGLLYQLTFMAETEAFEKAYQAQFIPQFAQNEALQNSYSFNEKELKIDLQFHSIEKILNTVKAFSTKNKLSYFDLTGKRYYCFKAELITNQYLLNKISSYKNNQMVLSFENSIIIKKDNSMIRFFYYTN